MQLTVKTLKQILEDLDLPEDVRAQVQAALEGLDDGASVDLSSFFTGQLTLDLSAEIQAYIDSQRGDDTDGQGEQPDLHGRMQDAEAFEVKDMDVIDPVPSSEITDLSLPAQIQSVQSDYTQEERQSDQDDDQTALYTMQNSVIDVEPDPLNDSLEFEFRTVTAEGNNLASPLAGTSHTPFMTKSGYQYEDGMAMPNDDGRPGAREISNAIFAQSGDVFNAHGISNFLWVWGQFLDHDINLTMEGHGESYNIEVPMGDPYFDPTFSGTQTITLTRSGYMDGTGDELGDPRLQMNEITAFIDASNVYGSTEELNALLRGEGGTLKMSAGDLLSLTSGDHGPEFLAGDARSNENVGLTSMHTVFAREHNHWVAELKAQHPEYSDDELYNMAKAIVEAEIQHVTYDEFLPLLLGEDALADYAGYDPTIDPQIATEFATAAFRVGHTMLSSDIFRLQEDGDESDFGHLTLQTAFFRPDIVMTQGGIDEILRGLGGSESQAIDASIIDDVRNFLFGPPGAGGFDLVSLNIQRGRDHGLPDFNSVRESYGLDPLDSFADLTSDMDLVGKLTTLYGTIDYLDLWVGGLIEAPYAGGLVGETFFTIIADQFTRLRDGDRFWYEERFDDDLLDIIHDTSLSDIIMRNTDIEYLQDDIFSAYTRTGGDDGDNVIVGTDDNDLLIGFAGNDVLNGGLGENVLYGGEGADTFVFDVIDGAMDIIRDFNSAEDVIELSDLLDSYDPVTDALEEFVSATTTEQGTILQVDQEGTGSAFAFENLVFIENITLDYSSTTIIS